MDIIRRYKTLLGSFRGAVVAIGNFDGVHLGHRGVIDCAAELARAKSVPLAVLTFEPHPITVLRPETSPRRLSPFRVKVRRLRECGVEILYMLPFSSDFSKKTPENFIREVLVDGLGVQHVVVGHDYQFGKGRAGDSRFLVQAGEALGFGVTEVSAIGSAGGLYSSTRVRSYLRRGEPHLAAAILGHMWEVEARVVRGDARGRKLGYPTANIEFRDHVIPGYGIYAVWCGVIINEKTEWYAAVANVGIRPMFELAAPILEVHLMDYDSDLYGKYLRVAFVSWIRPEEKFESLDSLIKQMNEDVRVAEVTLAKSEPPTEMWSRVLAK